MFIKLIMELKSLTTCLLWDIATPKHVQEAQQYIKFKVQQLTIFISINGEMFKRLSVTLTLKKVNVDFTQLLQVSYTTTISDFMFIPERSGCLMMTHHPKDLGFQDAAFKDNDIDAIKFDGKVA